MLLCRLSEREAVVALLQYARLLHLLLLPFLLLSLTLVLLLLLLQQSAIDSRLSSQQLLLLLLQMASLPLTAVRRVQQQQLSQLLCASWNHS